VDIPLSPAEADALHSVLEDILESGAGNPELERAYRLLGWRILAAKSEAGTGLIGRLVEIAKSAGTLEDFEKSRDEELGPIIQRLEGPENRDP
jgi:hypothetical protein